MKLVLMTLTSVSYNAFPQSSLRALQIMITLKRQNDRIDTLKGR